MLFRKRREEKKMNKEDNRGISLVELLVAFMVLAIVALPFLQAFYVSARNNLKSRNVLRATTVAQNLMEGIEGYSLEEISGQLNNTGAYIPPVTFFTGTATNYREVMEDGTPVAAPSGTWIDVGGTWQYSFSGNPNNKYYFLLEGVEEDGITYDVRLTLDASGYRSLTDPTASEADRLAAEKTSYNEDYYFSQNTMNDNTDIISIYSKDSDAQSRQMVIDSLEVIPGFTYDKEGIRKNSKRVFRVIIKKDASGKYNVTSTLQYEYIESGWGRPMIKVLETDARVFTEFNNVYIMYFPNYESVQGRIKDTLIVESYVENPFNIYLIKQVDSAINKAELQTKEANYRVDIRIYDVAVDNGSTNIPNYRGIQLRTNIISNMAKDEVNKDLTNAINLEYHSIAGLRGSESPNYGSLTEERKKEILGFVNGLPQYLSGEVKGERAMYTATVEVFPSGTATNGNFSDENRLAVLSNN